MTLVNLTIEYKFGEFEFWIWKKKRRVEWDRRMRCEDKGLYSDRYIIYRVLSIDW